MPESRDRLSRAVDLAAVFARRRAGIIGVLDDGLDSALFGPRRETAASMVTRVATGSGAARGGGVTRSSFGTPRNVIGRGRGRGRNLYVSPDPGGENSPFGTARRGRGRSSQSVLPSWYPRTPLRDITAVVRAIERRRARLGEIEGQQTGSPFPADQYLPGPSVPLVGAQLKQGMIFPNLDNGVKLRTPAAIKVPKILLDISTLSEGESEFLTPQKKLLNSIDTVEKVVREELQKLKRTPSAKKAEREKRVRTLMSMR